jgi:outer membrane protein assembly factor BamB
VPTSVPAAPDPAGTAALTPGPGDWTTFGHDPARTAQAADATVNPTLSPSSARDVALDGAVYGQPLVVGGTVFAATENGSVYAVSAADGSVVWRSHLADPFHPTDCGDIKPLGITGTPVYDPATRTLYAVADRADSHHVLFGLDAATGRVRSQTVVDPPGSEPGDIQQRSALTWWQGKVFVPFGGLFGDCGTYTGAVAVVTPGASGGAASSVDWFSASGSGRGGMWAPGGAVLADDRLFFSIGNGDTTDPGSPYDGSDSVVALDGLGRRVDFFAPAGWAAENASDQDLGSMNPALVGGRIVVAGKAAQGYVLDPAHLGGIGGARPAFGQCAGFGAAAVRGDVAYVPCGTGTTAVRVAADGTASVLWHAAVPAAGQPSLGGGLVWVTDYDQGVLYALDPADGRVAGRVATRRLPHFAAPSVSGNRVFLGTLDGVTIYTAG